MARDARKMYRFALYGQSGSGKSCLLGTMALVGASSRDLTCEFLPVEVPEPKEGPDGQMQPSRREALSLHRGKQWLTEVQERLRQNDVPKPNPPEFDAAPPMFDFRIGDPRQGDRLVRLIDYSGELINPEMEHDPESFVRKLRDHLSDSDGFLILAETPRSKSDVSQRMLHLKRLREAFKSLQEARDDALRTPVCIVLTKWDRHSKIEREKPENELNKLLQFFDQHPEFDGLVNSIGNALAPQEAAVKSIQWTDLDVAADTAGNPAIDSASRATAQTSGQGESTAQPTAQSNTSTADSLANPDDVEHWGRQIGNVWVFPATAFGAATGQDGKEVPNGLPRPFGILEPFVWLAQRRDVLDAASVKEDWSRHAGWAWLPFAFVTGVHRRLRRRVGLLTRRVPPSSRLARPLAQLRRRLFWAGTFASFVTSLALTVLSVAAIGTISYSRIRYDQFAYWRSVVENPASTGDELLQARDFFDRYASHWWNGLLVPSPDDAKNLVGQADEKIDDILWQDVDKAVPGSAEQREQAQKYLEALPAGRHAEAAKQIIADVKNKEEAHKNAHWLSECERELASAGNADAVNEVRRKLDSGFPAPASASNEQQDKLQQLQKQAEDKWAKLDWAEFQNQYGQAMRGEDYVVAADLLAKRQPRDDRWRQMVETFSKEIAQSAEARINKHLRDAKFDDARKELDKAETALKQLESSVRFDRRESAASVLETLRTLEPKKRQIDEAHDRFEYSEVHNHRTAQACERYLNYAPLKTMERPVKAYLDYLRSLEKPISVNIGIKIFWHENYSPDKLSKGDNYIHVWVDDTKVFESREAIAEDPGNLSGEVGKFPIRGKRIHDRVTIRVKIVEDDSWGTAGDDDGGTGEQTCSLKELHKGIQIPLRPQDGSNFENRADLEITSGWPDEPNLPTWRE